MANTKPMKSVHFRSLLPDIYKKLIIDHCTHLEVSLWLQQKHGLDLLGRNGDGTHFSNYLSLYGDIKTAKESYENNIGDKSHVAKHWYKKFIDDKNEDDVSNSVSNKPQNQPQPTSSKTDRQPVNPLRQVDSYRDVTSKKIKIEDVLSDFEDKL